MRWAEARAALPDPFSEAPRRDWSAATWRLREQGLGRFRDWAEAEQLLGRDTPAAACVTRSVVERYHEFLTTRNAGYTIASRLEELSAALGVLAPDQDWTWINRAAGRIRARTVPARDKASRLRPIQEIVATGFAICKDAEESATLSPLSRAVEYRDGLLVAFLGLHALRRHDLARIELDKHLVPHANGFTLEVPVSKSRDRKIFAAEISGVLAEHLLRYLSHYRPQLLARGRSFSLALWISEKGTHMEEGNLAVRIRKAAKRYGMDLSPHLVRSCAATTVAIEAPEAIDMMPAVLTHSDWATTAHYYALATGIVASRRHASVIADLRRRTKE
jgi:hypothetical protein